MKRFIMRSGIIFSLVFMAQLAKAQMTVVEYFDIKSDFKVDLKDKKNVKSIYTKGVLEVQYNPDKRILSVAYDPKEANIEVIVRNINSCAGETVCTLTPINKKN
jgi:copper chaperone CopZ